MIENLIDWLFDQYVYPWLAPILTWIGSLPRRGNRNGDN